MRLKQRIKNPNDSFFANWIIAKLAFMNGSMEFRHLQYFIAVAEELHFTRATERLHIERSLLSRAIKKMENELGVRLFDRNIRSIRLTRAGQVFLEKVPHVFVPVTQPLNSVRARSAGYFEQLRLAPVTKDSSRHN
jgi:DNA-binding transcriptional LysR family regulator